MKLGCPRDQFSILCSFPDSKVHGAIMGPIWGRQDPGGPHVGPMNFVIWVVSLLWPIQWRQVLSNVLANIRSGNDLVPVQCQATTSTNDGIFFII